MAAQKGSRPAFERLYKKFVKLAHGVLLARHPPAVAEELAQECFLIAFKKLDQLREPAKFAPWLVAIARRLDAPNDRRAADPLVDVPDSRPDAADLIDAAAVVEAIRRLPDAYRETLILRLVEGMSGAEIAAATDMTAESVRVNLHRGMTKLREALGIEIKTKAANE